MYTKEEIQQAKDANLVDLLQDLGYPLKKITAREYALIDHDSCKISPSKGFYWHSRGVGGNAIDFFMILEGKTFMESVELILSRQGNWGSFATKCREVDPFLISNPKPFVLPVAHWNNSRVIRYLTETRKLDQDIVQYCIKKKQIYESADTHNAVFVGYDPSGRPACAFQRGTTAKRFAGDIAGSNKEYGFFLGNQDSDTLHLFESPIDLISYLTLEKLAGRKCPDAYISLSGISLKAFQAYYRMHPAVRLVYVRSDNDAAGHKAYVRLLQYVEEAEKIDSEISILPAYPKYKDYNEDLVAFKEQL